MFAADGKLVGVAEVVVRGAAELSAGQIEHLDLIAVQILIHPVVNGVAPLGTEVGLGLAALTPALLLRPRRLPQHERVHHRYDLYLLQRL